MHDANDASAINGNLTEKWRKFIHSFSVPDNQI